jgi:hypothetical protein
VPDTVIIAREEKARAGGLGRLVWVTDRGFAYAASVAAMLLHADKLRHTDTTNSKAAAALARARRYSPRATNLALPDSECECSAMTRHQSSA